MCSRKLLSWMLVLLTSGVVGLAVPKTSYGLEICTSLKCVDRGRRKAEGVERKKAALLNPRKRTTRSRRSRDSRDSTPIRFRYLFGSNKQKRTSPRMDGSTIIKNETVSVIYGKWGLSYTKHHFIGYWDDPSQGNFPHEELNVESLAVNYSFGENLTFTLESLCMQKEKL